MQESTQLLSIHNLQNHAAIFTKMLLNNRLLDALADIIGTKDILLHHTKAHVKPPGKGSPFPMHQARFLKNWFFYWNFKNDGLILMVDRIINISLIKMIL